MSNTVESLVNTNCYSSISFILKAIAVLSNTTVRRSAINQKDLKPYWKPQKRHTSLGDQQAFIYKFLKDFTNHRKNTNRAVVFAMYLSPTFLNTGTTDETLQQSGKQNVSSLKLKSSPTMYESSGSQF